MLKILGLTSNPFYENESSRKLNSTRNKSNKEKCNESTAKKKSKRKSIITSPQIKNLNTKDTKGYQYIQQKKQKALNYLNNLNTNIINTCNKKNIKFSSSLCDKEKKIKNKNKKNARIRNSIDTYDNKIKNVTCDKKIKEIKIKSNFNLSYINLFVNKNKNNSNEMQNLTTIGNNQRIIAESNINKKKTKNIFFDNVNISLEKNKTIVNTIGDCVYKRKKLFNSMSMEKKPKMRKEIESIEISFSPKMYINKFQINNNYNDIIIKGISCLNMLFSKNKKKMFYDFKFMCYNNSNNSNKDNNKDNEDIYYVDENQIELLNVLKQQNISSMIDLKKYIVDLIKKNKLEMF